MQSPDFGPIHPAPRIGRMVHTPPDPRAAALKTSHLPLQAVGAFGFSRALPVYLMMSGYMPAENHRCTGIARWVSEVD